jgi:hypothetical protein
MVKKEKGVVIYHKCPGCGYVFLLLTVSEGSSEPTTRWDYRVTPIAPPHAMKRLKKTIQQQNEGGEPNEINSFNLGSGETSETTIKVCGKKGFFFFFKSDCSSTTPCN